MLILVEIGREVMVKFDVSFQVDCTEDFIAKTRSCYANLLQENSAGF